MCDFKKSTGSVGLKIHQDTTKIPSNKGSNKKIEVTIDNIKVEVLPAKVSRTINNVRATRNNRNQGSMPEQFGHHLPRANRR